VAAVFPEGRTEEAVEKYIRTPRFKQARAEAFSDALMTLVSGAVAPIAKGLAGGRTIISGAKQKALPRTVTQYLREILKSPQKALSTAADIRVVPQTHLGLRGGAEFLPHAKEIALGPGLYRWSDPGSILQHELGHAVTKTPYGFASPSEVRGLEDLEKVIREAVGAAFPSTSAGRIAYTASPPEMLARYMERLADVPGPISPEAYKRMFREALATSMGRGKVISQRLAEVPPSWELADIEILINALSGAH